MEIRIPESTVPSDSSQFKNLSSVIIFRDSIPALCQVGPFKLAERRCSHSSSSLGHEMHTKWEILILGPAKLTLRGEALSLTFTNDSPKPFYYHNPASF